MTFREAISKHLFEHVMWEDEIAEVLTRITAPDKEGKLPPIAACIDRDISGYPNMMLAATLLIARTAAVQYLKEVKPDHIALMALRGRLAEQVPADPREAFGAP
jgi:hypothetical protein